MCEELSAKPIYEVTMQGITVRNIMEILNIKSYVNFLIEYYPHCHYLTINAIQSQNYCQRMCVGFLIV